MTEETNSNNNYRDQVLVETYRLLAKRGDKIPAIKLHRAMTSASLLESKQYIESLMLDRVTIRFVEKTPAIPAMGDWVLDLNTNVCNDTPWQWQSSDSPSRIYRIFKRETVKADQQW